jgi:hypothetical protein
MNKVPSISMSRLSNHLDNDGKNRIILIFIKKNRNNYYFFFCCYSIQFNSESQIIGDEEMKKFKEEFGMEFITTTTTTATSTTQNFDENI